MPLLINELVYDEKNLDNFFNFYTELKETSKQFRSKPIQLINSPKFLFISQGEYCIVDKNDDNIDYLGSDEATTCCLLFLDTQSSIAVAHLDNGLKFESLDQLVNELINHPNELEKSKQLKQRNLTEKPYFESYYDEMSKIAFKLTNELNQSTSGESSTSNPTNSFESTKRKKALPHFESYYEEMGRISSGEIPLITSDPDLPKKKLIKLNCRLVGSYYDEKMSSFKFINKLLNYLNRIPDVEIRLELACILQMNTTIKKLNNNESINYPIFYGAAVELKTNQLYPAEFERREPEIIQRKARHTCSSRDLVQVYNSINKLFVIDEFRYFKFQNFDLIINSSDEFFLNNFSTSPKVEPAHFVKSFKDTYNYINKNYSKRYELKTLLKRKPNGQWSIG